MKTVRRVPLALVAALVLAVAVAAQAQTLPDRIVRTGDRPQITNIRIKTADLDGVVYQKFPGQGAEQKIALGDIEDISWGDMPGDLRRIDVFVRDGKYKEALPLFARLPEKISRDFWYQPYRHLQHGRCLIETKQYADAVPKFDVVINRHAQSMYLLDAIQGKAKALLAMGDYAKVPDVVRRLEAFGPLWKLRSQVQAAEAHVRTPGQVGEAARLYKTIVDTAEKMIDNPGDLSGSLDEIRRLHQSALVGRANVLIQQGQADEAQRWINSVSDKVTDPAARTSLYMALGDLAMADAKKEADAARKKLRYKEALLAYMRVYILYPGQTEVMPKALLQAGTASMLLDTAADKARARQLFRKLTQDFPKSPEAKAATPHLQSLGG
jgi:tetratricopeptide (TPR) repeat protein